jgi:hypothetical protein
VGISTVKHKGFSCSKKPLNWLIEFEKMEEPVVAGIEATSTVSVFDEEQKRMLQEEREKHRKR